VVCYGILTIIPLRSSTDISQGTSGDFYWHKCHCKQEKSKCYFSSNNFFLQSCNFDFSTLPRWTASLLIKTVVVFWVGKKCEWRY